MYDYIRSPVLVPFCSDPSVLDKLANHTVFISPMYSFWGRNIEMLARAIPTKYTLEYMIQKINDDYSGINDKSPYYSVFESVFNNPTANCIDKLYQIKWDQIHKDILVMILSSYVDSMSDDMYYQKKVTLNDKEIIHLLEHMPITKPKFFNIDVRALPYEIYESKFLSIVDIVPRIDRFYTPNYLGALSLFTGRKEISKRWDLRLDTVCKKNLINGAYCFLVNIPSEYELKVKKVFKQNRFVRSSKRKFVWRKPDLIAKKLNKGIKNFYW